MNSKKSPSLFIPGPVEVLDEILKVQTKQMINHRGKEFSKILHSITENLSKLFVTDLQQQNSKIFTLSSSGTGAVEAAFVNLVENKDRVLCIDNGWFGARLTSCAGFYSNNVKTIVVPWGKVADLQVISKEIEEFKPTILAIVHNDTSTGVCNPIEQICSLAKEHEVLTLVDSVSGLGGSELEFDKYAIDVCASSSQKCVGSTPGVSYLAVSSNAWKKISQRNIIPSFYFDLKKYDKFLTNNQTPFTPNESAYFALEKALELYFQLGLSNNLARHKQAARLVDKKLEKKGYLLFAQEGFRSNTLTTFKTNKAQELQKDLLQRGYEISLGMADYSQTVCRIGHMGNFSEDKLAELLDVIPNST